MYIHFNITIVNYPRKNEQDQREGEKNLQITVRI